MKRFFALAFLLVTLLCSRTGIAYAAASPLYARAMVKTAYFFSERDTSSSLFAVPYTYCVEVLRDEGDWLYVRYANDGGAYKSLTGYCRSADFDLLDAAPATPYLYKTVSVRYTTSPGASTLPVLNELTIEAAFYGTYYSGATAYSYVLCNGSFGYIEGANDDYPLQEIAPPPSDAEPETPQKSGDGVNAGAITAIIIVALAGAALALLIFTAKKRDRLKG